MVNPEEQELLRSLENRPVSKEEIVRVIEIESRCCNFPEIWSQISDLLIMKVFGRQLQSRKHWKTILTLFVKKVYLY